MPPRLNVGGETHLYIICQYLEGGKMTVCGRGGRMEGGRLSLSQGGGRPNWGLLRTDELW